MKKSEQTAGTLVELPHDAIHVEYIALSTVVLWDRNPKKHDIGAIVQSIAEHGFRDPPAYDATLGAIVEGNGRTEALQWMRQQEYTIPRGIGQIVEAETGVIVDWAVPVAFGVDALSRIAAERYGIDHNNLVLSGGDFDATDYARLWERHGYLEVVRELAEQQQLPVSVSGADVEMLVRFAEGGGSIFQVGYEQTAGDGVAEGPQFDATTDFVATIGLTSAQASDTALKTALAAFCQQWNVSYKIRKGR